MISRVAMTVAFALALATPTLGADIDCFAARDSGVACSNNSSSSSRMFYYLPRLGTCQPFMYQGCGGNTNRFASAQECRAACANAQQQRDSASTDSSVQMKNACSAKYDTDHLTPVRCSSNACPIGHNCIATFCCPTSNYLCNLTYDSGKFSVGGEKSDKYFWVPKYSTCMRFSFYGTLGNANNFPNYNTCMQTCGNQTTTAQ